MIKDLTDKEIIKSLISCIRRIYGTSPRGIKTQKHFIRYISEFFTISIPRKLRRIERWIAYRTYDKYHVVNTKLEATYWDKDEVMLHACFSLLEDFVEKELSVWEEYFENKDRHWKRLFKRKKRLTFEKVVESLDARINEKYDDIELGDWADDRKKFHTELKELYIWWKKRPERIDPDEATGYTSFYELHKPVHKFTKILENGVEYSRMDSTLSKKDDREFSRLVKLSFKKEQEYDKEDQKMLIRLMKIRKCLWT